MRRNPEIERLEMEVASLRRQLAERQKDPGDLPFAGCGDSGCCVARPGGMATNGGCRCERVELRGALHWWKRRATFLEETVRQQRDELAPLVAEHGARLDAIEGARAADETFAREQNERGS